MDSPPVDYMICPCCGTEFGLDDVSMSYDDLRILWAYGKHYAWFSQYTPPPPNWNPTAQLGIFEWQYAPLNGGVVNQPEIRYAA